jgi:hypothetical protein
MRSSLQGEPCEESQIVTGHPKANTAHYRSEPPERPADRAPEIENHERSEPLSRRRKEPYQNRR